jgi:hypothetical protein
MEDNEIHFTHIAHKKYLKKPFGTINFNQKVIEFSKKRMSRSK